MDTSLTTSALARELDFQLFDVLQLESLLALPRFGGHDRSLAGAMTEAALALAAERFAPCAARLDVDEPRLEGGRVVLPPETAEALSAYADGGFGALAFPRPLGGLGLPFLLSQGCSAAFAVANVPAFSYAMLTQGAANVVARFGSEDQRRRYLPALLDGRAFGTMCLSEPEAGSSLGDLRCAAEPADAPGRYRIQGRKMWISGGEHELAPNIFHLVLARLRGAPPGVKGISLFIVPRYRVDADGGHGMPNGVSLVGLNHKMGWRGHVNTALAFGDEAECLGELVGREHEGLGYMFHMMNEARVGVGLCAAALGYAGYRYSLGYAQQRLQGRAPGQKDPGSPQLPIIRHADVRRMLLAQKAWTEGAFALVLYCARLVDELAAATEPAARERASLLLELLTPVAKSWPAEYALEANKYAIQVAGGAGYTRDLPLERLYRDNRLNHIHEGALGIHGLDLVGRKLRMQGGRPLQLLLGEIHATIRDALATGGLEAECRALAAAVQALAGATRELREVADAGDAELAFGHATPFLDAFGTVVVAWRWLEMAVAASRLMGLEAPSAATQAYVEGKLRACRGFFRSDLPRARSQLALLRRPDNSFVRMADDQF